jgi:hypothetical protein
MISVKKNWDAMFFAHDFHEGCEFACPQKVSLSFRRANDYRNFDFNSGRQDRLQQNQIGNVEMA